MKKLNIKSDNCIKDLSIGYEDNHEVNTMEIPKYNIEIKRFVMFILLLVISIMLFVIFINNKFISIVSFNIFGLSLAALTSSTDNDRNYDGESFFKFVIGYFHFINISLLISGIIFLLLEKFIINNDIVYYLVGFTSSIYLMSHIDFLKNNLLFFRKTK